MSLNLTGNNLIPYPYQQTNLTTDGITFTDNGDGTITANGTATADASFKCWAWLNKVLPSGSYFVSGCPQNGSVNAYYMNFAFKYNNINFKDVRDIGAGALIEAPNGIEGIYATIRIKSGTTVENLVFKPMLNKGTTALPYEPYKSINPENIRVNTGTETKDVEKVVVAKSPNLMPYPYQQTNLTTDGITFTDNGDGTITANGTATADASFKCWAWLNKVLPSGSYFVSGCPQNGSVNAYYMNFAFKYNNINFKDVRDIGAGALIEAPNGIEGIYAMIRIKSGITVENLVFKPMLNKGTTALPYQKYDREVVWSKTGTSYETTDEETTV